MNKTIVVFGSSTGTCEAIAEKIAQKLGCEAINVQDLTAEMIENNQNLILGTSTWGAGELQDDWYDGLRVLQAANLADKTIALFGCGDCESYGEPSLVASVNFIMVLRRAVQTSLELSAPTVTPSMTLRQSWMASLWGCPSTM